MSYMDPLLIEAFGLDPDVVHLNHGAFGVAPVAVRRAAAAWRERAERNPHRFNRVELPGLIAAARQHAAGISSASTRPARRGYATCRKGSPRCSARSRCSQAMSW